VKRAIFVTWVSAVAAGVVACASSEALDASPTPDGGGSGIPDSAVAEDAAPAEDASAGPACSADGWCETEVPDDDLSFVSVWPLEGRAFATAQSPLVGFKVLEWSDASAKWTYIDDKQQNQAAPSFISSVWAPTENEVYYATSGGTIAHGTRPSPSESWSWDYASLPNNVAMDVGTTLDRLESLRDPVTFTQGLPTIGVWGTSAGEVYAWYTNTIFRRVSEGGAATRWVAEYTADDTSDVTSSGNTAPAYVLALGATGTGPNDLWFTFVRNAATTGSFASTCPVLVRKTSGGYARIVDGVVNAPATLGCTAAPDYLFLGSPTMGWLSNLQSIGNGQVVGVLGGRELVNIASDGGSYRVTSAKIMSLGLLQNGQASPSESNLTYFTSAYATSPTTLWFAGQQQESFQGGYIGNALAVRGDDVWNADAATYQMSSISLTGAPLAGASPRIRGTSDRNLWLVSKNHALHKTQ
jgi:hypothetical protein